MTNDIKLAYLAGILDGEGYFSISIHKPRRRHFPLVGVINTDKRLMDWLKTHFGGVVYFRKSPSFKPHWKDRYDWRITQSIIDCVLPAVLPYLVIKRQQAEAILKLRATVGRLPAHILLPEETFQEREHIRAFLKSLNYRSHPV